MLQQQLVESQRKIIELQQRIDEMMPKNAPDQEISWHIASNGIMSEEAASSEDIATVRKFKDWNVGFAQKHIKPYVNPQVYGECLNQMTRGLSTRIAELETRQRINKSLSSSKRLRMRVNMRHAVL
jgi:hypothetical protein